MCLEALLHAHQFDIDPPQPDSGDLKKDIKIFLTYEPAPETAALRKRLMPHLMAYSARNPEFGRAWRARITGHVHGNLRKRLRRGIEAGAFPVVLDGSFRSPCC